MVCDQQPEKSCINYSWMLMGSSSSSISGQQQAKEEEGKLNIRMGGGGRLRWQDGRGTGSKGLS